VQLVTLPVELSALYVMWLMLVFLPVLYVSNSDVRIIEKLVSSGDTYFYLAKTGAIDSAALNTGKEGRSSTNCATLWRKIVIELLLLFQRNNEQLH
jgi:hypothetical protein